MDVRHVIAHHIPQGFLIGAIVMGVATWALQGRLERRRFDKVMLALILALGFAFMFAVGVLHPPNPDTADDCRPGTC